jgi:ABC-type dipeptide/oligopeptide/nickel transport system permease component
LWRASLLCAQVALTTGVAPFPAGTGVTCSFMRGSGSVDIIALAVSSNPVPVVWVVAILVKVLAVVVNWVPVHAWFAIQWNWSPLAG